MDANGEMRDNKRPRPESLKQLKGETTRPQQDLAQNITAPKEFLTDRLDSISKDIRGLSKDTCDVKPHITHMENELQKTAIETREIKEELSP